MRARIQSPVRESSSGDDGVELGGPQPGGVQRRRRRTPVRSQDAEGDPDTVKISGHSLAEDHKEGPGRRINRIMAGYPVQRRHPPAITQQAARRRSRDSGTLSGTSAEEEQMTGKIMPLRERDTSTIQATADAFLSSPRYANPNTRRGYTGVLDRLLAPLGASRPLAEVSGEELADLLDQLWGQRAPATWNRNRGTVAAWLSWCAASRLPARSCRPAPDGARGAPQRHPRGTPPGDRPGADSSRRSAAGEDPVADAVRDRRPRQRGAGAEHRRPRPGRPPRPDPLQGRRHRMDLLGLRHRAPAATPHPRPPGRTGVPVRAPPRPRPPPRSPGPVPGDWTGPARLRPRPDPVHPAHRVASCTSCATPRRPISASKVSRCS